MARVVISLVTWNSIKDLATCFAAISAQTYKDFQLVIIDNASTDGTVQWLQNNELGIKNNAEHILHNSLFIIHNSTNLGFAGAHNQAIRCAREHKAEFVLVLNPDVILAPDAIEAMVHTMEQHPRAGSVGIPLLHPNGMVDSLGLAVGWGGRFYERGVGEQYQRVDIDEQVLGISGACVLYRLAALESVTYDTATGQQYFDERFFAYKEDVDLALRLRQKGWESWVTHQSHATHGRAIADASKGIVPLQFRGRDKRSSQRSYLSYRNHLYLLKKHWRSISASSFTIVLYELGKAFYALVREPWLMKAWREVWRF